MDTNLIIQNKINDLRLDLDLRASDAQPARRAAEVAVSAAVVTAPAQPCVSDDPQPGVSSDVCIVGTPMPIQQLWIEGSAQGHRVAAAAHRMSARGKAATKFSTRLGRRTCSPPV